VQNLDHATLLLRAGVPVKVVRERLGVVEFFGDRDHLGVPAVPLAGLVSPTRKTARRSGSKMNSTRRAPPFLALNSSMLWCRLVPTTLSTVGRPRFGPCSASNWMRAVNASCCPEVR
jgi:hypothetical protein